MKDLGSSASVMLEKFEAPVLVANVFVLIRWSSQFISLSNVFGYRF